MTPREKAMMLARKDYDLSDIIKMIGKVNANVLSKRGLKTLAWMVKKLPLERMDADWVVAVSGVFKSPVEARLAEDALRERGHRVRRYGVIVDVLPAKE